MFVCCATTRIFFFGPNNGDMTWRNSTFGVMGHLAMFALYNYAIMRPGVGGGEYKSIFRFSLRSFVQKWWVEENASFDNIIVQREPIFVCIAMAEGGLTTAQIENRLAILI